MRVICPRCPNCGAPVKNNSNQCEYCSSPVIITSFTEAIKLPDISKYTREYKSVLNSSQDNPELNAALAFCYLRLKIYEEAQILFQRAIDGGLMTSEIFFYSAVSLLNGKKAFLAKRDLISKIESRINAARSLEDKAIYAYFHAYIKYDYFKRKSLITSPDYKTLLNEALRMGLSEADVRILYELLNVERPCEL